MRLRTPAMTSQLHDGDCLDVMRSMGDCTIDALVTDPPAGIGFMGKAWDGDKGGRDQWVGWLTAVMRECMRVMKPGAHGVVWAIPRTSHWTAWALEDAGFEIRDRVSHLFGTGFPKSLDVSKAIDRAAGAKRKVVGVRPIAYANSPSGYTSTSRNSTARNGGIWNPVTGETEHGRPITEPATDSAKQWDGWGTALRPACEDWWLIRKPLDGTVAKNIERWGVGGLNIDACRFGAEATGGAGGRPGRWPTNLILDEEAAEILDESVGHGGASRFFYVAKPSRKERDLGGQRNPHPTTKSITLMRFLCRLVTPPGGVVFDPFCGSGSTGCAAEVERFGFIGIDMDNEHVETARRRISAACERKS